MIRKSILVVIGVVLVSLSVSNKAAARDVRLSNQFPNRPVLMDRADLLKLASRYGLTIRRIKVSPDLKSRLIKSGPKGCGCGIVQDDLDGFGSCFKNCLSSWGINQTTVIACGVTCTAAGTGNPIGIALCAGCLGVGEWIVAGCAMSCSWGGGGHIGGILGKNLTHRALRSAPGLAKNLKTRSANSRI